MARRGEMDFDVDVAPLVRGVGSMLARCRTFLVIVVLPSLLMAPAAAGPFEDGLTAYYRGDYKRAHRFWRPLAEQGDAGAQLNLGLNVRQRPWSAGGRPCF